MNHPRRGADQNEAAAESPDTTVRPPWLRLVISSIRVVLGVVVVVVVAVAAMIVFIPRQETPRHKLEEKRVDDLVWILNGVQKPTEKMRDSGGRELFQAMIDEGLWDWGSYEKLRSLSGPDVHPSTLQASKSDQLRPDDCSYTTPYGRDLANLHRRKGTERRVFITFNGRNWNNYPDHGVIVFWSDADRATWLTFEEAERDWGITWEEWTQPSKKLLGKKAPFEFTHE